MFLFHKWIDGKYAKYGINYTSEDDGIEIIIKIPLWTFWRKQYYDPEVKRFKSGKTIREFCVYIRRRSNSLMLQSWKKDKQPKQWVFDCMFQLSPYGKQEIVTLVSWKREIYGKKIAG